MNVLQANLQAKPAALLYRASSRNPCLFSDSYPELGIKNKFCLLNPFVCSVFSIPLFALSSQSLCLLCLIDPFVCSVFSIPLFALSSQSLGPLVACMIYPLTLGRCKWCYRCLFGYVCVSFPQVEMLRKRL
jgi:hypothetical protein